jgi:CheY-like chemotaxis protein
MKSVLIVEDDPDLRELLDTLLQVSGYQTMTAEHGEAALRRIHEHTPCLVLRDIMMPVMDGWEFRRRQLEDPAIATVPVLAVSAVFDRVEVERRLHVKCLRKPFECEELLEEIAHACGDAVDGPKQIASGSVTEPT